MKECGQVRKLLPRYLDKEANDREVAFIKDHLSHCHLCSREYSELSEVKQLMLEKERKSLPEDYLVSRLREEITRRQYTEEKLSWLTGMGNFSRRLIPIPVATIALSIALLIVTSRQQIANYSLDEHILSGAQTTTETALRVMLSAQN
ncbi:MAG: zf-HC2 domain-containing protein [Candidatus Omnitrophota bacterium]